MVRHCFQLGISKYMSAYPLDGSVTRILNSAYDKTIKSMLQLRFLHRLIESTDPLLQHIQEPPSLCPFDKTR